MMHKNKTKRQQRGRDSKAIMQKKQGKILYFTYSSFSNLLHPKNWMTTSTTSSFQLDNIRQQCCFSVDSFTFMWGLTHMPHATCHMHPCRKMENLVVTKRCRRGGLLMDKTKKEASFPSLRKEFFLSDKGHHPSVIQRSCDGRNGSCDGHNVFVNNKNNIFFFEFT